MAKTKADDYRRRARKADDQAKNARSLDARIAFIKLARQWRKLAEESEAVADRPRPLGP